MTEAQVGADLECMLLAEPCAMRRLLPLFAPLMALSFGFACGGRVGDEEGPGGDPHTTPTTTPSGTATTTATSEPTTPPKPPSCTKLADALSIKVTGGSFTGEACEGGRLGKYHDPPKVTSVIGTLMNADSTSFTLDTCSPAADCMPSLVTFTIGAPDLDLRILGEAKGGFVAVDLVMYVEGGCRQAIAVRTIDTWAGGASPKTVVPFGTLMFAGTDRFLDGGIASLGFSGKQVPLGCFSSPASCGVTHDIFALDFATSDGPRLTLYMGDSGQLGYGWSGHVFRDLRSHSTDPGPDCVSDWDTAWYALVQPGI